MKIITINTNGIRAAARKGFFDWLNDENPDVVCIQETKAQFAQLQDNPQFQPAGYHCVYHDAVKKGYSGVAMYAKVKPQAIIAGTGWQDIDDEGRYLEFQFTNLNVVSLYMHSGSSGEERQAVKEDFMARFYERLMAYKTADNPYIICGDINIVHTERDIKNARGNQNNWWSNRGQAWANNTGWRIDYQIVSDSMAHTVKSAAIYKTERFSDHAPLVMEYDFTIT